MSFRHWRLIHRAIDDLFCAFVAQIATFFLLCLVFAAWADKEAPTDGAIQTGDEKLAFPPNYNQEKNNRARGKARKALDKQLKREEKAAQRKQDRPADEIEAPAVTRSEEKT